MKKTKKRNRLAIFVLILFFLSASILYARATLIYEFDCSNQFGACSNETKNFLSTLNGKNYFHYKTIATSTLKEKYSANNVRFSYIPFNKVSVFVLEQTPDFAVTSDMQNFALVDKSGKVLSVQNATALPVLIKRDIDLSPGALLEPDILNALKILEYIYFTFDTRQAEMENGYIRTSIEDTINVIISPKSDIELEIGKLVFILSRLKTDETNSNESQSHKESGDSISYKDIKEIDLRFNRPILR